MMNFHATDPMCSNAHNGDAPGFRPHLNDDHVLVRPKKPKKTWTPAPFPGRWLFWLAAKTVIRWHRKRVAAQIRELRDVLKKAGPVVTQIMEPRIHEAARRVDEFAALAEEIEGKAGLR